ncbi:MULTISPECIES: LysR family transcriptional regulator [unclassified Clostridioides]|uniref:LysR family transcriptional regulator n=1 Tax=unclassified Clostridioides TaxID=2635829 RepID=UPI001D0C23E5|nr:LysR family transcriptional regulator [Clostridioides sp. ES-S-0001-02]MCC0641333.1 LysR family transcriptional regulator [Clostridioides sp. ES-S-0049-03]MCC0653890.1 LysR family transcriptional regulator [Clostridioides sp. ES-S-0001-03]MCC0670904.1 LysR family transcriptional regulator [Clostridioides sp. ES-S-0145-01]MCC0677549.1 LysR family transcriptional regulator [Clostridioides sp. ES-W-0018-02]MCC0682053.1 LysR family transcriptional regulator [Clostridioides sp. ES-S-0005-03]MCC
MNTKQLEYFISVAENLSFTKTAEKFYISQTAVTQQIKALEEKINVTLFTRSKRHVELTPAGKVFLSEARTIIKNINDAIEKTQQFAHGSFGTLSIGILIGYEKNKFQQYLKEFSNTYPNISMEICTNEITELLNLVKNNFMDLAFVINPENQPLKDFEYKTVERYSLVALLPHGHPLCNEDSIDLIELQHEKFIFVKETGDEYGQKSMIQNRYREAGFVPNVVQRSNDFNTIESLVASNMGISILPSFCVVDTMIKQDIAIVPINEVQNRIEVVVVWNKNNTNPALEKFISII